MHKHLSKDFARRGRAADAMAFAGAGASGLGRRPDLPALFARERRSKARPVAPLMGQEKAALGRSGAARRVGRFLVCARDGNRG